MIHLEQALRELFVDLHLSGLWVDEKAISDAILKRPAEEIAAAYDREKSQAGFDLRAFFAEHFDLVAAPEVDFAYSPDRSPEAHIEALWPYLHKEDRGEEASTKLALPHPYVVPGGRFQEIYYWDSYFTQLGLLSAGKPAWVYDLLDNFAHLIHEIGHIPNGNRTYFLSRSQPPFFALMIDALAEASADPQSVIDRYLPALEKEYAYWCAPERTVDGLTHYYDASNDPRVEMYGTDHEMLDAQATNPLFFRHLRAACESGWDFSSRWLENPMDLRTIRTMDLLPVDLNSLLYFMEHRLSQWTGRESYQAAAERRLAALQDRFYSPEYGFCDIDHVRGIRQPQMTAAALFPLFVGAARQEQADRVADRVRDELLQPGGLATTAVRSGQQWDAPNGWAPLQWVAVVGLAKYGHTELARTIAERWIKACDTIYYAKGRFVEKYNVYEPENLTGGGEYELQDGFGWTNGVYLALKDALPKLR